MRRLGLSFLLLAALAGTAVAQSVPVDVQRDCQTVRTCQFARGASVRGCLSSFTCRTCRFVTAPCRIEAGRRVCQEMRCSWGG